MVTDLVTPPYVTLTVISELAMVTVKVAVEAPAANETEEQVTPVQLTVRLVAVVAAWFMDTVIVMDSPVSADAAEADTLLSVNTGVVPE